MKSRLTALALLLAGILGCALQSWTLKTAYDPATRLVILGAASMTALKVFAFAVPVLSLLLAFLLRGKAPSEDRGLYQGVDLPCCLGAALAGGLTILGGLLQLLADFSLARYSLPALAPCAVDLLLVAGGICMIWLPAAARAGKSSRRSLAALVPGFAGCFWLILFYHTNSRDPVVVHYCWTLLALMAAILAFYFQAGYSFGRAHPVRAQACTLAAGIYALTALPGAGDLGEGLLLTGLALWMLAHCLLTARAGEMAPPAAEPEESGTNGNG